jgi:transcription elongation GreA/GreB family factor
MRKALDEEVKVQLPAGEKTYVIVDLAYEGA